MSQAIITVERLSKRYRIHPRARYSTLRDSLTQLPARLVARLRGHNHAGSTIWALKDASFTVERGEVLGIIGRNGAGKTTLLRLLSRITRPTDGRAVVRGRVGSLLEVGTGFHPELSGRENVYLSGAVLGMKRREISAKFDEITAFAGVEQFLETPLKHYSVGMQTRLAFAVAAHLEPEILLVDEVLAVGDLEFQKKCLGKMGEVARGGRTVLLVSHQMNQIRRLAQRVLWLDGGETRELGSTPLVVSAYEAAMTSSRAPDKRGERVRGKGQFVRWELVEPRGEQPHLLESLGPVTVKFVLEVNERLERAHHGIALYNTEGQLMWAWATDNLDLSPGAHEFRYIFPMLPLRPGNYAWQVSLFDEHGLVDYWHCLPEMIAALPSYQHRLDMWTGWINVPCQFGVARKE
jgi:homopolymeric O-antigen transport system ATP-binding protein